MEKKLTHSKWFLYLTEFFAGMSVMAVELGASRLMAPYFSSSQIVWTVIIGVIMVAMAVGNIWGGRMADKSKSPDRLYGRVIIAAIWIALIPFAGRWMIAGISFLLATFVTKNFLVWAALAACLAIFAFPCVLLGTVTPSLTKFTVDNLDDTGKTVGQLNALNTIGSIIGTFVPTFLTIPAVGTAATFLIFAGVLAAIGIVYFTFERKKTVAGIIAVVLVAGLCFALPTYSFAFWESDLALEDESIYNYLQVKDDDHTTTLSTNVLFGVQSVQNKDGKLTGMYYDYALAAPCMAGMDGTDNTGRSAMILGMGSGTYAGYCVRYFPGMTVQGAEIDGKIADIARTYFGLPEEVEVAVADGRAYLTASEEKFDVIILDPPAFTKSRNSVKNAVKGYREINLRAMKLIKDGGYLATCSCSHFMTYELFTKTIGQAAANVHKRLRQVSFATQAPDHPILWAADTSYYLKFYIFQVCDEK